MERLPLHENLTMKKVTTTLSQIEEPLTALTYYDPTQPLIPYTQEPRGRFNIQGKFLHILGISPEKIAVLTPTQVRTILADGLVGSNPLQRGFLPFFDSDRFPLHHRNGSEVVRILRDPNLALGRGVREIAKLAEVISGYTDELKDRIKPVAGSEGMLYATNIYACKLLMAAVAYFQAPPMYNKDKDIRRMANFTAQAVIRNVGAETGLPPHITDIACWAANELQVAGNDGHIAATVSDPVRGDIDVKSDLFFVPLLVGPEGQRLTIGYLRYYRLKSWERPLTPIVIVRNRERFRSLVAERRAELKQAKEGKQTS